MTTTRIPGDLATRLTTCALGPVDYSEDRTETGVVSAWAALARAADIIPVGTLLHNLGARLSMISAFMPQAPEAEEEDEEAEEGAEKPERPVPLTFGGTPLDGTSYEVDYHFDLGGDTLTVIAFAPAGGAIDSLSALFRTANWPEREIMEIYNLRFSNHPDPRRLFVDQAIDQAVLERLIPYSTLVNAASTKDLWDRVLAGKGGAQ